MPVDRLEIGDPFPHAESEIDDRLALVFGGMLLGIGLEDRALGLARRGQRHRVFGVRPVEHARDHAVLSLVDRRRGALPPHRPVDRLDGELARVGRRERLPARNLPLARLPRADRGVQRLLNRLVDRLGREPEQGAQPRRGGRSEMGDVVDLVGVQADALHQVDLDLVGGRDAAHEVLPAAPRLLRHRQDGRDVVARMGVVGGEEGVVEIELADRRSVRPGGPFGGEAALRGDAEHRRAARPSDGQAPEPARRRPGIG